MDPKDLPIVRRRRAPHLRKEEQADPPGEPFVYQQARIESAPENREPGQDAVDPGDEDPRALADEDNWDHRRRQPDDPSALPPADPDNRDPRRPGR